MRGAPNRGRARRARQRVALYARRTVRVTAPREIKTPEDLAFLSTAHLAENDLEIDLTDVEWISPLGVVAVLATCLRADRETLDTTVDLPESREVRTYLAAIGLLDEVERHGWSLQSNVPEELVAMQVPGTAWTQSLDLDIDPEATFAPHLPVSRLASEPEVVEASYLLDEALHAASLTGGLFDDLIDVAVELAGNAREHGSNCYIVAQTHTGRRSRTPGLRLAVADFGAGFARTLQEHYGDMTNSEAIVRAFEEQVSGTGDKKRGFGLSQIAGIIDMGPENVLHIVSWTGNIRRAAGQVQVNESASVLFPGTAASVYVPYSPL